GPPGPGEQGRPTDDAPRLPGVGAALAGGPGHHSPARRHLRPARGRDLRSGGRHQSAPPAPAGAGGDRQAGWRPGGDPGGKHSHWGVHRPGRYPPARAARGCGRAPPPGTGRGMAYRPRDSSAPVRVQHQSRAGAGQCLRTLAVAITPKHTTKAPGITPGAFARPPTYATGSPHRPSTERTPVYTSPEPPSSRSRSGFRRGRSYHHPFLRWTGNHTANPARITVNTTQPTVIPDPSGARPNHSRVISDSVPPSPVATSATVS